MVEKEGERTEGHNSLFTRGPLQVSIVYNNFPCSRCAFG